MQATFVDGIMFEKRDMKDNAHHFTHMATSELKWSSLMLAILHKMVPECSFLLS